MKNNIVSLRQLLENGYDIKMKDMALTIYDKNKILTSHETSKDYNVSFIFM